MRWLCEELSYRDPSDDLSAVDTGKYLETLSKLPGNLRQLLQEGDVHAELQEIDGHYRVTKIIKKREPGYLQGADNFFILDKEGKRIRVTEEEFDKLLGMKGDPEDVYNSEEVEIVGLETNQTTPLDKWDVLFDATEYVGEAQKFIDDFNEGNAKLSGGETPNTHLERLMDTTLYSADWFPYPADKRLKTDKVKNIAQRITKENMTKQQLAQLLAPPPRDERLKILGNKLSYARNLPFGKEKGKLMVEATKLKQAIISDKMVAAKAGKHTSFSSPEKKKLWALWQDKQTELHGEVKLPEWQFKRKLGAILSKEVSLGLISQEEALNRLSEALERVYRKAPDSSISKEIKHITKAPLEEIEMPEWLSIPVDLNNEELYGLDDTEVIDAVPIIYNTSSLVLEEYEHDPIEEMWLGGGIE